MVIRVGKHSLICGDITDGRIIGELMRDDRADVIYSDPPWGPGNQKYWHTMNRRGDKPRTTWDNFLTIFCEVCAEYRKQEAPVFIEMGLRWVDALDQAMARVALPLVRRWQISYGPKSKPQQNTVALYGVDVSIKLPDPSHGEPITRAILGRTVTPGAVVFDPCTGRGMTARITNTLGGVFRGSELNSTRLAVAESWLRKNPGSQGILL